MDETEPDDAAPALTKSVGDHVPLEEPTFPTLTRIREMDREMHIERAVQAGMTREQAERHADDDMSHWSPRQIEERPREE